MTLDLFIVDAFSDRPLAGNPAGVCPLDRWLPEQTMQAIAAEMNLSETCFIVREGDGYRIRWFTPTREVDLVGHATLAAGAIVLERLDRSLGKVDFQSKGGELTVSRSLEGYSLVMPALIPQRREIPTDLVEALGLAPLEVWSSKHYLSVFQSEDEVVRLAPDMAKLAALDLPAVIVTALGTGDIDFVSRFFAPANGVPEDPVSGVAHCCLTPYWAVRLGKSKLQARQLSRRGGYIACEDMGSRVRLNGAATVSLEGTLSI